MPVVSYTFSEKEIDAMREIIEQMDIELGSILIDVSESKTLKKIGRLSSLQGKLYISVFGEDR